MKKHHFSFVISLCVLSFSVLTIAGCNLFKSTGEESGELQPMPENVIPEAVDEAEVEMVKKDTSFYKLIDPQTMEQVLQYKPPAGWMTGGKSEWNPGNPSAPNYFYVYAVSPDASIKFATSSNIQLGGQGKIDQDPLLQPNTLAEKLFVPSAQRDYNLSNVHVVEALYEQAPDSTQRQQNHKQQGAAMGLRFTDIRCVNYKLKVAGTRDGKEYYVIYLAPMDMIEMRPGMSFVHTAEMTSVVSFGGPMGTESQVELLVETAFKTLEFNQSFLKLRQEMAQILTQQSIAEANKKWEAIRQRHLQNMRESDERLNNFLEKSNRDHQRVMAGSGSGSSGSTGSMLDKWDEYIKDVDRVDNPNGGEMYIDNRYDHAWINSDNEIMYMDSALFNPNENAAFNNREWKRVR